MLAESNVYEELRRSSLFAEFPESTLQRLAEICKIVEFKARTVVFEEYDVAKYVYVILSGEVSIAICDPKRSCRQIGVVRTGDLLGWSPLVGRSRLYDTARTTSPVKALAFVGSELMDFCGKDTAFGYEFMRRVAYVLAERLSGTRLQMVETNWASLPEHQLESD
jgi:CRP-like cAMP-binding protein